MPAISAMSLGPYSFLKSMLVGLILGSVAFLAQAALKGAPEYDYAQQLRTWLDIVGVGLGLSVAICAVMNYIIGTRIEQEVERSRERMSTCNLAPLLPSPDWAGSTFQADELDVSFQAGRAGPSPNVEHFGRSERDLVI